MDGTHHTMIENFVLCRQSKVFISIFICSESQHLCLKIVKRSESVIDIMYRFQYPDHLTSSKYYSGVKDFCSTETFDETSFITLVNPIGDFKDCPLNGKYMTSASFIQNEQIVDQLCHMENSETIATSETSHSIAFGCLDSKMLELSFECNDVISSLRKQFKKINLNRWF